MTRKSEAHLSSVVGAIRQALADWEMPGLVVGMTDRHELRAVVVHGYADLKRRMPLTAESRFAIGSISKSFTAMALLQMATEGLVDLHSAIGGYVRWTLQSPFAPITAHHLLCHTAGLPNYLSHAASSRYVLAALRDFTPSFAPGAHFWYSNTGYQLLGYLIEDLEGLPYANAIQRRILAPLGMDSTSAVMDHTERARMVCSYFKWPSDGSYVEAPWFEYAAGDGSLVSSVPDMCAYARCILNRGAGPKGRLLTDAAFATWTTPALDGYAYGLFVRRENESTLIGHNGGIAGFLSVLDVHLEEGFGIVIMSNCMIPADLRRWISDSVAAAFRGQSPPAAPIKRNETRIDDYAGVYCLRPLSEVAISPKREFVVKHDRLWLKHGRDLRQMERMGGDCFRVAGPDSGDLPFFFGRADESTGSEVIDVSHGAQWCAKGSARETSPATQQDYSAYVGHFENNGPEGPDLRVFVRNGQLLATWNLSEGARPTPLEPMGDHAFRYRDQIHSPERVVFDTFMAGRALRMLVSGVPLYRKDTP